MKKQLLPTSLRARRQLAAEAVEPVPSALPRIRSLVGWVLVASVLFFTVTNFTMFSPSAIGQAANYVRTSLASPDGTHSTDCIDYPAGTVTSAVSYNRGLALIDTDTLYIAQGGSLYQQSHQLSYSKPVLRTNGSRVLVFDRGGTGICLSSAVSTSAQLVSEGIILDASLGMSNDFAVVSEATGYRAAVSVYTDGGKLRFRWSTPDYYVQYAALSPSGKRMCALAFRQEGLDLQSSLLFFDLGQDSIQEEIPLGSVVGAGINFIDENTVFVVSDTGLQRVKRGDENPTYLTQYSADELLAFSFCNDRVLLATRAWSNTSRASLALYDPNGAIGTASLAEDPISISLTDRAAAVLTAYGLHVYNNSLEPEWTTNATSGASRVLLESRDSAWLLLSTDARRVARNDPASNTKPTEGTDLNASDNG